VNKIPAKITYVYTSFGANNDAARDYIANKLGRRERHWLRVKRVRKACRSTCGLIPPPSACSNRNAPQPVMIIPIALSVSGGLHSA
jgi:hypothetical protein